MYYHVTPLYFNMTTSVNFLDRNQAGIRCPVPGWLKVCPRFLLFQVLVTCLQGDTLQQMHRDALTALTAPESATQLTQLLVVVDFNTCSILGKISMSCQKATATDSPKMSLPIRNTSLLKGWAQEFSTNFALRMPRFVIA